LEAAKKARRWGREQLQTAMLAAEGNAEGGGGDGARTAGGEEGGGELEEMLG
jgi:hypothetical protein